MTHRPHALTMEKPLGFKKWQGRCSCGGWTSTPMRSKKKLRRHFNGHCTTELEKARGGRSARSRSRVQPRPLTPVDQLPEQLR